MMKRLQAASFFFCQLYVEEISGSLERAINKKRIINLSKNCELPFLFEKIW